MQKVLHRGVRVLVISLTLLGGFSSSCFSMRRESDNREIETWFIDANAQCAADDDAREATREARTAFKKKHIKLKIKALKALKKKDDDEDDD